MKRFVYALMVIAYISSLVSCGGETSAQTDTTALVTTETADFEINNLNSRNLVSDDIKTVNYGGREFNILSRTNFTYEFDSELTGDVLDDAVYNRNQTVEERFNIKIITHAYGEGNMANVLEAADKSIMAGDDSYQLLSAYTYQAAPGSVNGNYVNWYEIPKVNFDKPWWAKGFIEEASVYGKVFIATGDLSLLYNEVTLAMLFNKQLAEELNCGNLYEIVKSGSWTLDKLIEFSEQATQDLNGDSIMDANDRYGLGINTYTHIDCLLYAFEVPVTSRSKDGTPQIMINSQKMLNVLDKVYSFLVESGDVFVYKHATDAFEPGMFESNKGLFMTTWLGNCANLREMDTDFGIIPYPKLDENQENYSTYYLDRASCFLVPVTADLDFVGTVTEVLAAESYKQVIPAFYETSLKTKYARDNESQEMIDLILSNVKFDFGNIYTYAIGGTTGPGHLLRVCILNKNKDFASLYAQNESKFNENLNKLIESFK
jgi:hypothetical protein